MVLRWDPFDWVEEDQPVVVHADNPFSRIDVRRSSRHVRVDIGGVTVAESTRPSALHETGLPTRWCLPPEDVHLELLTPSDTNTASACKGTASYLGAQDHPNVAWLHSEPLHEAVPVPVQDMISFWRGAEV